MRNSSAKTIYVPAKFYRLYFFVLNLNFNFVLQKSARKRTEQKGLCDNCHEELAVYKKPPLPLPAANDIRDHSEITKETAGDNTSQNRQQCHHPLRAPKDKSSRHSLQNQLSNSKRPPRFLSNDIDIERNHRRHQSLGSHVTFINDDEGGSSGFTTSSVLTCPGCSAEYEYSDHQLLIQHIDVCLN